MRGLHKLTGAANTMQAREDYLKLCALATEAGRSTAVPSVPLRAGWRTLDAAAKVGVERLISDRPYLREQIRAIYPGFVD